MSDSEILLVEDQPRELAATKALLEDEGYRVTSASSRGAAVELFHKRASRISAAVIDLRLKRAANDVSGAEVAAEIKRLSPNLPTVSLSATKKTLPNFDFQFEKGSANPELSIEHNLENIAAAIDAFELSQRTAVSEKLDALRLKYQITDTDFQELISIRLIPDVVEQALLKLHDSRDSDPTSLDGLRRIKIIEPEAVRSAETPVVSAIPTVVTTEEGCVTVELYASPLVYAYGEDYESAVLNFLDNLKSYHEELSDDDAARGSADLAKFKVYLKTVFQGG